MRSFFKSRIGEYPMVEAFCVQDLSSEDLTIYNRVLDIVVEVSNHNRDELQMDSNIDDLGIIGMDADDLIEKVALEFNADFSTFDFGKYCAPESIFDFTYGSRSPLLIEDLFNAAKNKVWSDPPPREPKQKTSSEAIEDWLKLGLGVGAIYGLLRLFKTIH
jgi:hypothetical protein